MLLIIKLIKHNKPSYGLLLRLIQLIYLVWQITYLQINHSQEFVGFFYLITTIISLQLIGDLGLSQLTMNSIAKKTQSLIASNNEFNLSIMHKKILLNASVFSVIFVFIGFTYIFWFRDIISDIHRVYILAMIVFLGLDLIIVSIVSIISGYSSANNYYKYKFIRCFLEYPITIIGIVYGNIYISQFLGVITSILIAGTLTLSIIFVKLKKINNKSSKADFSLQLEFFPMQIKYMITWLGGFMTFSLLVPLTIQYQGLEVGGMVGTIIAIFNGLNMIFYTVINSKTVEITTLSFGGKFSQIIREMRSYKIIIFIVYVGLAVGIFLLSHVNYVVSSIQILENLHLIFSLYLLFFIHALIVPAAIIGNSIIKNNYHLKFLLSGGFNISVFIVLNKYFEIHPHTIFYVYAALQLYIYYIVEGNLKDHEV